MYLQELKNEHFFQFLTEADLTRLEAISMKKVFYEGEILFFKGDTPKYLHFMLSGIVKLYTHDPKDNEVVIHSLSAPSLIAEMASFEEIPYPANCLCETQSEILLIDYESFKEEFLIRPEISMFFIRSLSKKVKSLQNFISYNVSSSSTEKIAKFLRHNESILKTLKQVKIAQILNIAPETLSRKIVPLKKEGIIQNEKGYIKILDHDKLDALIP